MRIDDRLVGLFFSLLGLATILAARRLSSVPGTTYGPDLMPILIGLGMMGFGLKILWAGVAAAGTAPWIDLSAWNGRTRGVLSAVWTILGVAASIPLLDTLGLPLYGLLFCLPLMILARARLIVAVPAVLGTVLVAQFVFGEMLHVPLPAGLIPLPW
ncbi:tripartite tricarboxylate transporter TctB family protein [Tropicimonas sp. TH_r6]|uniref:tripartite tricarboxylate transporter TctB family protein n=1 Tax=Tropicimonas sp. TH_r6 TaxID=3082085 RepID=UPI002954F0E2|nr:tripartite tricarboxylate transporter TctB family protein [Tropicimonas sp. TH_r6]MDV7143435.1 tripartite tricarboxylate transporter TctB family protein [Tropicimonas sp. TH_r6]